MAKFRFPSKKKDKKINFFVSKNAVLETAALTGMHIELFADKQAVVEGCKGVIDYNDDYIKLRIKKGYLIFYGNSLCIYHYENETISVKGKITSLEFCI